MGCWSESCRSHQLEQLCPSNPQTASRMRTMAKLLRVRRYLHNVRSQSTSCKRGRFMSRPCEIRLQTACVMYTCFITPNQCPCLMRPLPCMAICRNTTTRRVASTHVSLSPLLRQCGARWVVHGRQVAEVRRTTEAITENDYVKILFRNGNLTSALAGWWRRLWAGSGCGGSGRAPGWCGWAVASLLRRCCGGAVCWRPAISLPA